MRVNHKKNDIAKDISISKGYSLSYSKKITNDLLNCIIDILVKSNLNLKNFGAFKTIEKSQRIGRNPKTKVEFLIKSKKTLKFIASNKFKSFLND